MTKVITAVTVALFSIGVSAQETKPAKKEKAKAIFLGDYVDRGPDSIKTLEILIEAKRKNPVIVSMRPNTAIRLSPSFFAKMPTNHS